MSLSIMNLVKPKVGAKCELLLNKPASKVGLLNINVRLSNTTKCDQYHISDNYEFGST